MVKRVILCADDFGQNAGISQGILKLIRARRITATSCLVTARDFEHYGPELSKYASQIDVGLHLNLTHGYAFSSNSPLDGNPDRRFPSVGKLLIRSLFHRLSREALFREFELQLLKFQKVMGCLPDFLDGHQHIHHFPVVREALQDLIEKYFLPSEPPFYVRSVWQVVGQSRWDLKTYLIRYSGAKSLEKWLSDQAIDHNTVFTGIYDFTSKIPVAERFEHFFANILDGGLMMCHPGLLGHEVSDPLYFQRDKEFAYLMSEAFDECLARNEIQLIRGIYV